MSVVLLADPFTDSQHGTEDSLGRGVPLVKARIDGGRARWFVLDTGSVGLRVFAADFPQGASLAFKETERLPLADGSVLSGPVVDAVVGIAGLHTTREIQIQYVTHTGCARGFEHCPGFGSYPGLPKIAGLLGVGLDDPPNAPSNPLEALPAPYSEGWSIHMGNAAGPDGSLRLGVPPSSGGTTIQLATASAQASSLVTSWSDATRLCWRAGHARTCGPAVFDTGSDSTFADGLRKAPLVAVGGGHGVILQGKQFVVSAPDGKRLWTFEAGDFPDGNLVITDDRSRPNLNSGIAFFYAHTVTYNPGIGTIRVEKAEQR